MKRNLLKNLFSSISMESGPERPLLEQFYIDALKAGRYKNKSWIISVFSVTSEDPDKTPREYDVRYNRDTTEIYLSTSDEMYDWVTVPNHPPLTPLLKPGDDLTVHKTDIPNLNKTIESTYGILLFNWIVLVEPFEHRIDYMNDSPINIRKVEGYISELLVSDEDVTGVAPQPHQITISMYMRYGRCIGSLAGLTQMLVPTLTPKALTTDPRVRERRAQLLEENKDRLFDPVVQSRIQNELIAMDRAWIKGDPSEGFLLSNKTFGTARKRMFLIHGPEAGFDEGTNATLVVNSLNEGWDTDHLVPMFNSTRAGSFFRGALTALGGEAVKFFMRVFQNLTIVEDDCKSKLGILREIEPGWGNWFVGLWELKDNGTVELITKERLPSLEGKTIRTRTPLYCKTKGVDYCAKCVGEALASVPTSVGSENTAVASQYMDIMMASAHAKELKTTKIDFKAAFT